MMNEEITWFTSKLIPNFKEQNIDPKLVIGIIEEGLQELKDEGFYIDIKESSSTMYNLPNGEIKFGKERKIITINICNQKLEEFNISDVKDYVLTLVDMVKSNFGLDCILYYNELEEHNFHNFHKFKTLKLDIVPINYKELENLNDIIIGEFKIIIELT